MFKGSQCTLKVSIANFWIYKLLFQQGYKAKITLWNMACFLPRCSEVGAALRRASGSHFTKLLSMVNGTWQLCWMSIWAVVVQFLPAARWSAVLPFSIAASTSAPASSSRFSTSRHCGMNDRPVSSWKPTTQSFEFSFNYTKVAILPIKGYVGESKINLATKVTSSGISTWDLLCSTLMPS